jgi:chromosome partitioning protein
MKTLSIISHKGGAGKTSSAVMLAEDLAGRGLRVVLIDADRQRGAGLLLGIEQPTGLLQQTKNPKLRYFCSSIVPLREITSKAEELAGNFDVGVVDTPSLDDPLAKMWIQLSTDVLMVLPVEPVSLKTLESADTVVDNLLRLNEKVEVAGVLPTMFDENDSTQRSLLLELRARRPDGLLPAIPLDSGLVHRAEQRAEKRTEPGENTRAAYAVVGDSLIQSLKLQGAATAAAASFATPPKRRPLTTPAVPDTSKAKSAGNDVSSAVRRANSGGDSKPVISWSMVAIAALVFALVVGASVFFGLGRGNKQEGGSGKVGHSAPAKGLTRRASRGQ